MGKRLTATQVPDAYASLTLSRPRRQAAGIGRCNYVVKHDERVYGDSNASTEMMT